MESIREELGGSSSSTDLAWREVERLSLASEASIPHDQTRRSSAPKTTSRTRLENEKLKKELQREKEDKAAEVEKLEKALASKASARDSRLAYLEARHEAAVKSRLQEVRKLIVDGQTMDLAFLFDATYSMQPYIDLMKNNIVSMAEGIGEEYPECRLRVAFAQYRDYDDREDCASCDFTSSFGGAGSTFITALSQVHASGGGDVPEDVFTGLERAASLSWEAKNRVLVHIADAPCHGTQFHNLGGGATRDSYPLGDKLGRDITALLQELREGKQISVYSFHHVNKAMTGKMLKEFKKAAGGGQQADWIQEEEFDKKNSASKVVSMCTRTISETLRTVATAGGADYTTSKLKTIPCVVESAVPEWSRIGPEQGSQFKYKWYDNLDELLGKLRSGRSLELEEMGRVLVRVAPHPFSTEGATRWPYYAQVMPQDAGKTLSVVLKRFKVHVGEDTRKVHKKERYVDQMEVQSVSAQLAEEFNKQTRMLGGTKQVTFTLVSTLELDDGRYYNMERLLNGEWIRYSNNAGYVNTKDYAATLQAFSHWTHERSSGQLMVTDLQGVQIRNERGDNEFWLCDPAIHCNDMLRFTRTNLGEEGFKLFYKSHQCNDVCHKLRLMPGKNGSTTKGTHILSSPAHT